MGGKVNSEQLNKLIQSSLQSACPACQYGVGYGHWASCPRNPANGWGQGGTTPYPGNPNIIPFPATTAKEEAAKQEQLKQFMQKFASGATRSSDEGKNHYDGYLSMEALEEFGDYMTRHRVQADGSLRGPSNWKLGIPLASYVGSLLRHTIELVGLQQGYISRRLKKEYPGKDILFLKKETACACWFNVQGFIHQLLKESDSKTPLKVTSGTFVQRTGDSVV